MIHTYMAIWYGMFVTEQCTIRDATGGWGFCIIQVLYIQSNLPILNSVRPRNQKIWNNEVKLHKENVIGTSNSFWYSHSFQDINVRDTEV